MQWTNESTALVANAILKEEAPAFIQRQTGARNRWLVTARTVLHDPDVSDKSRVLADAIKAIYCSVRGLDASAEFSLEDFGLDIDERLPRVDPAEVDWRQIAMSLLSMASDSHTGTA